MPRLRSILFRVWYPLAIKPRISRADNVFIHGLHLTVLPSVFHPALYRSSHVLLEFLATMDLRNKRVLDMGTGSGAIAIAAAKKGARVQAFDINPVAVQCARANSLENGVSDRVEVKESDLFSACTADERFDYIIWNPPFYDGTPTGVASMAWFGGKGLETIDRFIRSARAHLTGMGQLILLLSSDMNQKLVFEMLSREGFEEDRVYERRFLFEKISVLTLCPKE